MTVCVAAMAMAAHAHDPGPACLTSKAAATQKGTFHMRKTAHQFRTEKEMNQAGGGYLDFGRQMTLYDEAVIKYSLSTTPDGLGIHPNLFHLKNGGSCKKLSNEDWELVIRKRKVEGKHKIAAVIRDKKIFQEDGQKVEKTVDIVVDVTNALIVDEGRVGQTDAFPFH